MKVFLIIYTGTVIINLLVSAAQFFGSRKPVYRILTYYWLGILAAAITKYINILGFQTRLISAVGTFASQLFLAILFAEVRDVNLPVKKLVGFFLFTLLVSTAFYLAGADFATYGFVPSLGSTAPVFYVCYAAIRERKRPFTRVQKLFFGLNLVMAIHYLNWAFVATKPHLLMYGNLIAVSLFHLIAVFAAMMANEDSLQRRADFLTQEILARARQLDAVEHQAIGNARLTTLGRMAGGIAHEINNPLSIVSLKLQGLQWKWKKGTLQSKELHGGLEETLVALNRISVITRSLHLIAGKRTDRERIPYDLRTIAEEAAKVCADRIAASGIRFQRELPAHVCLAKVDAGEISQALTNLLTNAVEAVELAKSRRREPPEVRLSLRAEPTKFVFAVEDTGFLDPNALPNLMDPFFTTKPLGTGAGLGLSTARAIAASHGGMLFFDSAAPRTRFVLEIPVLEIPPADLARKLMDGGASPESPQSAFAEPELSPESGQRV